MPTVTARLAKTTTTVNSGCPCNWGKHCRCTEGARRFYDWELVGLMRTFLRSGADLTKRRRAIAEMRETIAAFDQVDADTVLLREFYDTLPRRKDIDLVQRITCDDHRAPQTDEEIAERWRTPLEHVRDLRARVAAVYAGNPLPMPREWRAAARVRRAKERREREARAARRAAARAARRAV